PARLALESRHELAEELDRRLVPLFLAGMSRNARDLSGKGGPGLRRKGAKILAGALQCVVSQIGIDRLVAGEFQKRGHVKQSRGERVDLRGFRQHWHDEGVLLHPVNLSAFLGHGFLNDGGCEHGWKGWMLTQAPEQRMENLENCID